MNEQTIESDKVVQQERQRLDELTAAQAEDQGLSATRWGLTSEDSRGAREARERAMDRRPQIEAARKRVTAAEGTFRVRIVEAREAGHAVLARDLLALVLAALDGARALADYDAETARACGFAPPPCPPIPMMKGVADVVRADLKAHDVAVLA